MGFQKLCLQVVIYDDRFQNLVSRSPFFDFRLRPWARHSHRSHPGRQGVKSITDASHRHFFCQGRNHGVSLSDLPPSDEEKWLTLLNLKQSKMYVSWPRIPVKVPEVKIVWRFGAGMMWTLLIYFGRSLFCFGFSVGLWHGAKGGGGGGGASGVFPGRKHPAGHLVHQEVNGAAITAILCFKW